jgi:hypothetical protein
MILKCKHTNEATDLTGGHENQMHLSHWFGQKNQNIHFRSIGQGYPSPGKYVNDFFYRTLKEVIIKIKLFKQIVRAVKGSSE